MLNALKTSLAEALDLSKDALHVHLGLAVFLLAVLVLRTSLGSWLPWFQSDLILVKKADAFHRSSWPPCGRA